MGDSLQKMWWVPVVRGVSAIAFGILMLVWPAESITAVAIIFASLFAVYGVFDIIGGVMGISKNLSSIFRLLLGLLELGIVVYLFKNAGSGLTLAVLGVVMAVAVITLSLLFGASALLSDASAGYRWALGIAAVFTLYVGITVARLPAISFATMVYTLGVFGLFVGPIEIATGFMLKNKDS